MASGFTGRGLMQAPGIGRALTELITTGAYQSIDISNRIFLTFNHSQNHRKFLVS